nr:hypothetical protein SYMBAF_190005 [Serratia symbiotica]
MPDVTSFPVFTISACTGLRCRKICFGRTDMVLRQTPASIPAFSDVPLSTPLRRSVELPGASGLFPDCGRNGAGKTSTAAAVLRHRIAHTGQLGVSIEDPAETLLQGRHGKGRCIQLEVRKMRGTPVQHAKLIAWVPRHFCWAKFAMGPRHMRY